MRLLPNFLDKLDIARLENSRLPSIQDYKRIPSKFGNFYFKMYGKAYGKDYGSLPYFLRLVADKIEKEIPGQIFTTWFLQRYEVGQFVAPHQDPTTNIGYTYIAPFGHFKAPISHIEDESFILEPGDVLILPCTIKGIQGPLHSVESITEGVRYTFIGNTIV